MPTYHYLCDSCQESSSMDQPMGSEKQHPCHCGGNCKRVIKKVQELTPAGSGTPGSQVERSSESRAVDVMLTRIRRSKGLPPNTDGDQLAADRHWGRKNGIV